MLAYNSWVAARSTTPDTPGAGGTWEKYFDASDVGISGGSDVDGVSVAANGDIYLSTDNLVTLPVVSAENEDIFICISPTLGETTACTFSSSLFFDGSDWALEGNTVDAFSIQ